MHLKTRILCSGVIYSLLFLWAKAEETLPALQGDVPPQNYEQLWKGYDPRKEPLDVEVLHEWEENGVVLKVIRYRIGVFKGKKAMMAAVYGYPKGAQKIPGLLNIHGGGQRADANAVLTNAKRGYATISIAWAGRIIAKGYNVLPPQVKLFWDNKVADPEYKVTTDWGALDAYHAPSRYGKAAFTNIITSPSSLDPVPSPRNNSWFLCALGARRALTFLERQPEVDGSKMGVYGHSMGGKLSILTAGSDRRVKAVAPSCGGISDRYNKNPLHRNTVGDSPYLKHIGCPVIFLNPANDFHGHINDLPISVSELKTKQWRVTCNAHLNHRDLPSGEVATQLWFDQYLKKTFTWPETPRSELRLKTADRVPIFTVTPDASKPIVSVDVYYTQQGVEGGAGKLHENRINRYWHHAVAIKKGETWSAQLPVSDVDQPLWVYANVLYRLEKPISGAGYYYRNYTAETFNLSSLVKLIKPGGLKAAGVKATLSPSLTIEDFQGDWKKKWFQNSDHQWEFRTHKIYHPLWKAPNKATVSLEVFSERPNKLVIGIDRYAVEMAHSGGSVWKQFTFSVSDFKDAQNQPLKSWDGIKELRILPAEHLRSGRGKERVLRLVGTQWKGALPQFRRLRWERR